MILDSGVAELANTGNRHDFRYRTWPCKNVLRTSVLGASTPGMSQAAITVISGLVPRMLMTRVDPFLLSCGEPISRVRVGRCGQQVGVSGYICAVAKTDHRILLD
jgi:hypothetical protein